MRIDRLALALLALTLLPASLSAQAVTAPPLSLSAGPERLYERSDSLFDAWEPAVALELLEGRIRQQPLDYHARWRAAQAALVLGILEDDPDIEVEWFQRAGEHGDAAVAIDSAGVDGLYWASIARGRLALQYGPRTSTELVQQMWDMTEALLRIDPDHPGAHNTLGKLNHEVEILSRWQRILGKLVLRKPFLSATSWGQALEYHRRAVELDPEVILFRKDLGESLHRSGDPEAARAVFEEALTLPEVWPVDARFKDDIRRYMAERMGN